MNKRSKQVSGKARSFTLIELLAVRKGFTLIELLVVVAIISILAALLLPGLKQARNQAKQIACMAHLRQVSQGLFMLADDSDGWLDGAHPGAPIYAAGHIGTDGWYNAMGPYLGKLGSAFAYPATFPTSGSTTPMRFCPDFRWPTPPNYAYGVYGVNTAFVDGVYWNAAGPWFQPPHALSEVTRPTTTHLVAECNDDSTFRSINVWDAVCLGVSTFGTTYVPRHGGRGLNCIFVDGHGEFLKYQGSASVWNSLSAGVPTNPPYWSAFGGPGAGYQIYGP